MEIKKGPESWLRFGALVVFEMWLDYTGGPNLRSTRLIITITRMRARSVVLNIVCYFIRIHNARIHSALQWWWIRLGVVWTPWSDSIVSIVPLGMATETTGGTLVVSTTFFWVLSWMIKLKWHSRSMICSAGLVFGSWWQSPKRPKKSFGWTNSLGGDN